MTPRAIVLLSGGMDSATTLAEAAAARRELYALTFHYGQRHEIEIDAARAVAAHFGVHAHRVLTLDPEAFRGSALTGQGEVPKGEGGTGTGVESALGPGPGGSANAGAVASAIPSTYVPARNTIFLAYALGWAELLGTREIWIGVTAVDYSGYPDCRPEYIAAFSRMAALATKAGVEGNPVEIRAPLLALSKAEIIRRGVALGVDYALTHSCYDPAPGGRACGRCDACRHRRKGFAEAGVSDPTRYAR